jgi:uncharacterized membrane protein YsdA (DUF1294 family)
MHWQASAGPKSTYALIALGQSTPYYMPQTALVTLLFFNALCFSLFTMDKRKAQRGQRRISEKTLHLATLPGAAVGAWAAILLLHHKNRKPAFWGVTLLLTLAQGAFFYIAVLPHLRG